MLAAIIVSAAAWTRAPAQEASPVGDGALEMYLAERGLTGPLAAHLRRRLSEGSPEEKVAAAEALGRLYVRMLSTATAPAARQELEAQSRDLLRTVPEAESFELRIDLAKATYVLVEEIVERSRLHMARPDERAEAQRVLAQVTPIFEDLALKLHRRVEMLEKREPGARDAEVDVIREQLGEARRLRSLARYYAGWAGYYTALTTATPRRAGKAMEDFGAILNAVPGKPASLERLPRDLLRYEHVARAALGCALCASMLGNHVEAERWLDAVEQAEGVPEPVAAQVFSRRLVVSAAASQWADIEMRVKRRRQPLPGEPVARLSIAEARLVAVYALDAARDTNMRAGLRTVAERLAQTALGDLVEAGEVSHVLDLVREYGTAPIGEKGFIVTYVRGLQAYEKARDAHRAAGLPDEPATDAAVTNQYREAAQLFAAAATSDDVSRFVMESAKAGVRHGLSLYYAGDFVAAAAVLQRVAESTGDAVVRRDALWYAIVALDRSVEAGRASQIEPRDRLATLYLQQYPGTENAARLLLRQARADKLSDAKAVEVLLALPADSPLYESARRQAARMLYALYKRAGPSDRDFAALRFAEVAEQVLRLEQARALGGRDEPAREAALAVVLRVRQLADALLSTTTPDVSRVEAALAALAAVEREHALDLRELDAEIEFRRLQMALARGDDAQARRCLDVLRGASGPYARTADRLMYRRALSLWRAAAEVRHARDVSAYGLRVLEELEAGGAAAGEPTVVALRDAIAEAAAAVFRDDGSAMHRDLALRLDTAQLASGHRTAASLRRLAEFQETTSKPTEALAAWQELLLALPAGSDAWFEARYHSLRLLIAAGAPQALDVFTQFKAMYPDLGPEPWRSRFAELDLVLKGVAPPVKSGGGS
ncbi:MAG: hypothetical protein HBSAPP03_22160 [Phycisphaerae bacterium]|nr:MAG: hypothetical protein HBSAPP03_22160 [Phycisphaerae bacterium]